MSDIIDILKNAPEYIGGMVEQIQKLKPQRNSSVLSSHLITDAISKILD